MKYKIALCQIKSGQCNKEDNIKAADIAIRTAMKENPAMVILPEMWNCPYQNKYFRKFGEHASDLGNKDKAPSLTFMSEQAKKYGVYLIGGSVPELGSMQKTVFISKYNSVNSESDNKAEHNIASPDSQAEDNVYNTCFVFDKNGDIIARHRKVHLFDIDVPGHVYFKESDTLTPGDEITMFDTRYGKIGLALCYDIRFPEMFRIMALKGCSLVVVPGAFNMTTGPAHWELSVRMRSLDNQIYVAGCAPARDTEGVYTAYGHSCVSDPWANIIANADEREDVIFAEIDTGYMEKIRKQLPLLKARRPEIYI